MTGLIALEDSARVWLYQANRELTYDEIDIVRPAIYEFAQNWVSHNNSLLSYGNIFHRRFIGLFVDESASSGASGCSIDTSVQLVRSLGDQIGVDFFDRMSFCYLEDEEIYQITPTELAEKYKNGQINDDTLFFDHLVKHKGAFIKSWLKPLGESWHKRFV